MNLIRALMNICSNMRHHIDDDHKKWYKEAILIAAKRYIRENTKTLFKANKQSKSAIKHSKWILQKVIHDSCNWTSWEWFKCKIFRKKLGNFWWPVLHTRCNTPMEQKNPEKNEILIERSLSKSFVNFIKMTFLIFKCSILKLTFGKLIGNVTLVIYQMKIPDEIRTTMKRISFPGFQNIQMALKLLELFQSHFIYVKGHSQQCADSKATQGQPWPMIG